MKQENKHIMPHKNQSGFSLIEVLFSMAILSIGLLALTMMQGYFAGGNAQSRHMIRATDVAMDHIETLTNITDPNDDDLTSGIHTQNITTYPIDYLLAWVVTANGNGTLDIDITVTWQLEGDNHSFSFPWVKSI